MKKTKKKRKLILPVFCKHKIRKEMDFLEQNKIPVVLAVCGLLFVLAVGVWGSVITNYQASVLRSQSYHSAAVQDMAYVCSGDTAMTRIVVQGDVLPEEMQLKVEFLPQNLEFVSLDLRQDWVRDYSKVSPEDGFLYFTFKPQAIAGKEQSREVGSLIFKVKNEGKAELEFMEIREKDAVAVQKDQIFKLGEGCFE